MGIGDQVVVASLASCSHMKQKGSEGVQARSTQGARHITPSPLQPTKPVFNFKLEATKITWIQGTNIQILHFDSSPPSLAKLHFCQLHPEPLLTEPVRGPGTKDPFDSLSLTGDMICPFKEDDYFYKYCPTSLPLTSYCVTMSRGKGTFGFNPEWSQLAAQK